MHEADPNAICCEPRENLVYRTISTYNRPRYFHLSPFQQTACSPLTDFFTSLSGPPCRTAHTHRPSNRLVPTATTTVFEILSCRPRREALPKILKTSASQKTHVAAHKMIRSAGDGDRVWWSQLTWISGAAMNRTGASPECSPSGSPQTKATRKPFPTHIHGRDRIRTPLRPPASGWLSASRGEPGCQLPASNTSARMTPTHLTSRFRGGGTSGSIRPIQRRRPDQLHG